jgi:hypothetical protein
LDSLELVRVESEALGDFARVMEARPWPLSQPAEGPRGQAARLNLDANNTKNGLGQLVLTLVKLLHELLERQAIRRIEAGSLSDQEIERLGLTLMRQAQEIERLRKEFGLEEDDLNLDLGPLGKLL